MSASAEAALTGAAVLLAPLRPRPYDRLAAVLGVQTGGPRRRWWLVIGPVAVLGLTLVGPLPILVLSLIVWGSRWMFRFFARQREIRQQERSLLEAVSALAGELRAGRAPPGALAVAAAQAPGRLGELLHDAAAGAAYGADAGQALCAGGRSAVSAGLRSGLVRLGAAWTVSERSGAAWSEVIEQVERDLRAEQRHRQRMSAELAGSRATAVLLAFLPVVGLLLGSSLGADPVHVLTATGMGRIALLVGVALEIAGIAWTGRIVRSAQENS